MSAPGSNGLFHHYGMQTLGVPFHRDPHRFDVSRYTPDNHGLINAVVIEFDNPPVGQIFGRFGDFPAKQRAHVRPVFLFGQRSEEGGEKK